MIAGEACTAWLTDIAGLVASPLLPGRVARGSLPLTIEVTSLGSTQEFAVSLANELKENFVFSVSFECQLSFSFLDSEITVRIFQPLWRKMCSLPQISFLNQHDASKSPTLPLEAWILFLVWTLMGQSLGHRWGRATSIPVWKREEFAASSL